MLTRSRFRTASSCMAMATSSVVACSSSLTNPKSFQNVAAFVPSSRQLKLPSILTTRNYQRRQRNLLRYLHQQFVLRASAEGFPKEILEDPKFVPIKDDDPQFGPPAMLMMGVTYEEVLKVQELLQSMEGDFLKVLICTPEMIKGTLWDAVHAPQPDLKDVKTAQGVPRICFLSGLTGEEMIMFVRAFPEAKVGPVVFAALVPNNAQKTIEELMDEIMGDHERMMQKG